MNAAAHTAWGRFRDDILAAMRAGEAEQLARLTWNAERIQREQRERLQALLLHAAEHSPFHRRRLAGIDLTGVDPTDLSALPVMTKTQMMGSLDDVFTDRRLRAGDVESALAAVRSDLVPATLPLGEVKTPQVVDYQVRQTRCGIDVFASQSTGATSMASPIASARHSSMAGCMVPT
jgi:AcrR family transcriptional regulator